MTLLPNRATQGSAAAALPANAAILHRLLTSLLLAIALIIADRIMARFGHSIPAPLWLDILFGFAGDYVFRLLRLGEDRSDTRLSLFSR